MGYKTSEDVGFNLYSGIVLLAFSGVCAWMYIDGHNFILNFTEGSGLIIDNFIKDYQLVEYNSMLYLQYPEEVEESVSEHLTYLSRIPFTHPIPDLKFNNTELTNEQQVAVSGALNQSISIITGPGGTGKTTLIKELIYQLDLVNIPYLIVSFTGKAVSRVKQVTGSTRIKTLNMAIAKGDNQKFKHLIIDEISMVTTNLFYKFIQHFTHSYSITAIGDLHQLPPIGWGSLFEQMIKAELPTYRLTHNHRGHTGIASNTDRLLTNRTDITFESNEQFHLQTTGSIDTVYDVVKSLYKQGVKPEDIKIITPFNKYIDQLNTNVSQYFNGDEDSVIDTKDRKWSVNDQVMMIKNCYDIGIMNGHEGKVLEVDSDGILVQFEGKHDRYRFSLNAKNYIEELYDEVDPTWLNDKEVKLDTGLLRLSFAITIHKSQGSEWNHVILYIPNYFLQGFYNRNLIYTALTRGKHGVFCLGSIGVLIRAANQLMKPRNDNLAKRLISDK